MLEAYKLLIFLFSMEERYGPVHRAFLAGEILVALHELQNGKPLKAEYIPRIKQAIELAEKALLGISYLEARTNTLYGSLLEEMDALNKLDLVFKRMERQHKIEKNYTFKRLLVECLGDLKIIQNGGDLDSYKTLEDFFINMHEQAISSDLSPKEREGCFLCSA